MRASNIGQRSRGVSVIIAASEHVECRQYHMKCEIIQVDDLTFPSDIPAIEWGDARSFCSRSFASRGCFRRALLRGCQKATRGRHDGGNAPPPAGKTWKCTWLECTGASYSCGAHT